MQGTFLTLIVVVALAAGMCCAERYLVTSNNAMHVLDPCGATVVTLNGDYSSATNYQGTLYARDDLMNKIVNVTVDGNVTTVCTGCSFDDYFFIYNGNYVGHDGSNIRTGPLGGVSPTVYTAGTGFTIKGIAVFDDVIYWLEHNVVGDQFFRSALWPSLTQQVEHTTGFLAVYDTVTRSNDFVVLSGDSGAVSFEKPQLPDGPFTFRQTSAPSNVDVRDSNSLGVLRLWSGTMTTEANSPGFVVYQQGADCVQNVTTALPFAPTSVAAVDTGEQCPSVQCFVNPTTSGASSASSGSSRTAKPFSVVVFLGVVTTQALLLSLLS